MCILHELFHLQNSQESLTPSAVPLPRGAANELVIASILAPLAASDITGPVGSKIYALDASPSHGAIVSTVPPAHVSRCLCRFWERKGGYSRLEAPARSYFIERGLLDASEEVDAFRDSPSWLLPKTSKPIGSRFDFRNQRGRWLCVVVCVRGSTGRRTFFV